jgi:hypothetical protein
LDWTVWSFGNGSIKGALPSFLATNYTTLAPIKIMEASAILAQWDPELVPRLQIDLQEWVLARL